MISAVLSEMQYPIHTNIPSTTTVEVNTLRPRQNGRYFPNIFECIFAAKPLSEPMMMILLTNICITRPQWAKVWIAYCIKGIIVCSWYSIVGFQYIIAHSDIQVLVRIVRIFSVFTDSSGHQHVVAIRILTIKYKIQAEKSSWYIL